MPKLNHHFRNKFERINSKTSPPFFLLLPFFLNPPINSSSKWIVLLIYLSVVPAIQIRKITNIEQWTNAFLGFVAIYTLKYPSGTAQLMKYGDIVRDLVVRRQGAWQFYETQFRMLRVPINFAMGHNSFRLQTITHHFGPLVLITPNLPTQSSPQKIRYLENTFWAYNRCSQCTNTRCQHPHVCGFCRVSHHTGNCTISSKEQAA